jgi:hypothetical protein
MIEPSYPCNENWKDFLNASSTASTTRRNYNAALILLSNYCRQLIMNEGKEEATDENLKNKMLEAASVEKYLFDRRASGTVAKKKNERRKRNIGDDITVKANQLWSELSAIKKFYFFFNKQDPSIDRPLIIVNLKLWAKSDPETIKSEVFQIGY